MDSFGFADPAPFALWAEAEPHSAPLFDLSCKRLVGANERSEKLMPSTAGSGSSLWTRRPVVAVLTLNFLVRRSYKVRGMVAQ